MTALQRPPPPLRSYTETVQADVDDATSSSLFNRLSLGSANSPPLPTTSSRTTRRAPTLGTGDQLRRRRSNEEVRLPPGVQPQFRTRDDPSEQTPRPQVMGGIRRANSTDLLSLVDNFDPDDDRSDEGFSSEEEPFRFRPPSIASTTTSQHSSRRGIRIEDSSNRDHNIFVKQVSIPSYHAVGSEGSGFVVFDLEIQTLASAASQGTLIRVHKRYSAFVRLRADLIDQYPALRGAIPRLPPKSSLAKYRPSFLDKRRQNLNFWLTNVLLHPVLGASQIAKSWVLE